MCIYELLRRTLGLRSTHRVWRVYLSRLDTRDVVTRSVFDTGMSLLTFLVQTQQRHPSVQHGTSNDIPGIQTAEIEYAKRGVCFLIPGSGVIVHMYVFVCMYMYNWSYSNYQYHHRLFQEYFPLNILQRIFSPSKFQKISFLRLEIITQ